MNKESFLVEQNILSDGMHVSITVGNSMFPMLRNRKDTVVIIKAINKPGKYDVVLYKRQGQYVLHRIIQVRENDYIIRGDNCYADEYGINDDRIIGILTGFYRGEQYYSCDDFAYILYFRFWCAIYPLRKALVKLIGRGRLFIAAFRTGLK